MSNHKVRRTRRKKRVERFQLSSLYICFIAIDLLNLFFRDTSLLSWIATKLVGSTNQAIILGGILLVLLLIIVTTIYFFEIIIAIIIICLPFTSVLLQIPSIKGLYFTNIVFAFLFLGWSCQVVRGKLPLRYFPPGTKPIIWLLVLVLVSVITLISKPGGLEYMQTIQIWYIFKNWMECFIYYFLILFLIRSRATAKRIIVYMFMGCIAVSIYSIPEYLELIEDSIGVGGPHNQKNAFGSFQAYTVVTITAFLFSYIRKPLVVITLAPHILLTLKLIAASLSRAAYLGFTLGVSVTLFFRNKAIFAIIVTAVFSSLYYSPDLIPLEVRDRIAETQSDEVEYNEVIDTDLDSSAGDRLRLWVVALEMTKKSPFLGEGFESFRRTKDSYAYGQENLGDVHNMYLYLSSQMGVVAMFVFLYILLTTVKNSLKLIRYKYDKLINVIGLGGLGMAVSIATTNMFGTQFHNFGLISYFYTYYALLQFLATDIKRTSPRRSVKTHAQAVSKIR